MAFGNTNGNSISGSGLPAGGYAGYVLTKRTDSNYDTEWKPSTGLPSGGVVGDILVKTNTSSTWTSLLDVGVITEEIDPTVPAWAKQPNPPSLETLGAASVTHTHPASQVTTGKLPGIVTANNNTQYSVGQLRNIFLSAIEPLSTDGNNGDIWIVYSE